MATSHTHVKPFRVIIVEDRDEIRLGLQRVLERDARFSVVACCASLQEGFDTLRRGVACEVALVDMGLPDGSGVSFLAAVKKQDCVAVVLTQFDDDETLFEALRHGASGYLLKTTPLQAIPDALADAAAGGAPMSPGIARRVLASFQQPVDPLAELTGRELEVLRQLSHGHAYTEIAAQLGVTLSTVQTFVRRIYAKLDIHTKAEATRVATRAGLA